MSNFTDIELTPADNKRLARLCGQFNEHLRLIESRMGVEINSHGSSFRVIGADDSVQAAATLLGKLYGETEREELTPARVHLLLRETRSDREIPPETAPVGDPVIKARHKQVSGRGLNQRRYLEAILKHDISFGIGPAGTGKTYLAVACAVQALEHDEVRRILLTRPAVEAGERLGFLPGDLEQKIDPYLRPLYDALYEMLGFETVAKLVERNVIEVAPLAYMRGRTLNESFIILDEAQNTTVEQMKMFLTRIGFGSKAVITGDVTQVDLPPKVESGLRHVTEVLKDVEEISFTFFKSKDVVRHPLVQRIVEAYEHFQR
ncbi:MAG: PhoH family protein [Pseudomonadota bacterium]